MTKDFRDFTISYPSSMEFEESEEENGLVKMMCLIDQSGNMLNMAWCDIGTLHDDASTASNSDVVDAMVAALIENWSSEMTELLNSKLNYSYDISTADLSGQPVTSILRHVDIVYVDFCESYDRFYLLVSLGERGGVTFLICSPRGTMCPNTSFCSASSTR